MTSMHIIFTGRNTITQRLDLWQILELDIIVKKNGSKGTAKWLQLSTIDKSVDVDTGVTADYLEGWWQCNEPDFLSVDCSSWRVWLWERVLRMVTFHLQAARMTVSCILSVGLCWPLSRSAIATRYCFNQYIWKLCVI